jgi:hypothetical protein
MSTMSASTSPQGDSEVSPPASGTADWSANPRRPVKKRSTQRRPARVESISAGSASERKAASGRAPIAARSLRPRASVRCPTDSGGCKSRRKWRPSRVKSVVTRISWPLGGRRMAQSSPMPRATPRAWPWLPLPAAPAAARQAAPHRDRICSISSSSPISLFIVSQA